MSSVEKEYYEYLMPQDKSDLAIKIMNLETSSSNNRIAESIKENDKLKQQLAEKEKELKHLKELKRFFNSLYGKTIMNRFQEIQRQYKISFAIEQLEKVKEKLLEELQNVDDLLDPQEYEDYRELIGCGRGYKNSIEEIDNQIKQLKGENQ